MNAIKGPTRIRFNLQTAVEIGKEFIMPSIGRRVKVVGCRPTTLWTINHKTHCAENPYNGYEITVRHA